MLRLVLLIVLFALVARALWRLFDAAVDGFRGQAPGGTVPQRGVQMVRDPVCGTYVLPDRALAIAGPSGQVFFCSTRCRDTYRPSTGSGRPDPSTGSGSPRASSRGEPVEGRTRTS